MTGWRLSGAHVSSARRVPSCAGAFTFVAVAAVSLTACVSSGLEPSAVNVTPLVAVTPVDLEGSWGLASYRTEADRDRTIKEAKSACGNPYVVGEGSNGGVVMHLADQTSAAGGLPEGRLDRPGLSRTEGQGRLAAGSADRVLRRWRSRLEVGGPRHRRALRNNGIRQMRVGPSATGRLEETKNEGRRCVANDPIEISHGDWRARSD